MPLKKKKEVQLILKHPVVGLPLDTYDFLLKNKILIKEIEGSKWSATGWHGLVTFPTVGSRVTSEKALMISQQSDTNLLDAQTGPLFLLGMYFPWTIFKNGYFYIYLDFKMLQLVNHTAFVQCSGYNIWNVTTKQIEPGWQRWIRLLQAPCPESLG